MRLRDAAHRTFYERTLPGSSGRISTDNFIGVPRLYSHARDKKLSSTHAIGKCVFKLRGSLTNDERQALDAARRAFLASVEPRRRPSGEPVSTPQILPTDRVTRGGGKRSRDDDAPTDQLITPASQTLFTVTHLAPHDANERQPVETSCARSGQRAAKDRGPNSHAGSTWFIRPRVSVFARRNLTILAARCETSLVVSYMTSSKWSTRRRDGPSRMLPH